MKKYTKPAIEIVELESNQRMADISPVDASSVTTTGGTVVTVYNLAAISYTSHKND